MQPSDKTQTQESVKSQPIIDYVKIRSVDKDGLNYLQFSIPTAFLNSETNKAVKLTYKNKGQWYTSFIPKLWVVSDLESVTTYISAPDFATIKSSYVTDEIDDVTGYFKEKTVEIAVKTFIQRINLAINNYHNAKDTMIIK